MVYTSDRNGNVDLYVAQSDGSGEQRLTTDPGQDSEAAWSAAGRIAFFSVRSAGAGIFTMNADGADVRLIVPNGISGAWSPAGDRIAVAFYNSNSGNSWPGPSLTVLIANSDGSGLVRPEDTEYWTIPAACPGEPTEGLHGS